MTESRTAHSTSHRAPSATRSQAVSRSQAALRTRRDEMKYYEEPHYTCAQIAPEILRAKTVFEDIDLQKKWSVMRKLLVVSGAEGVDKTMKHLVDFDRSESIRPAGNVSNNIYNSILESRGFDIYGRLRTKTVKDEQIELRIEEGVDLEKDIEVPTIYEDEEKEIKKLPLTTSKWKIGEMEEYNAPVGFAKNPAKEFCSQGNEIYYSYDGEWKSALCCFGSAYLKQSFSLTQLFL